MESLSAVQANTPAETESPWRSLYRIGGWATLLALAGIVLDLALGNTIGGGMDALPKTAVERFTQLRESPWVGLYNLDLLNVVYQASAEHEGA